jgi:hypothetical protein
MKRTKASSWCWCGASASCRTVRMPACARPSASSGRPGRPGRCAGRCDFRCPSWCWSARGICGSASGCRIRNRSPARGQTFMGKTFRRPRGQFSLARPGRRRTTSGSPPSIKAAAGSIPWPGRTGAIPSSTSESSVPSCPASCRRCVARTYLPAVLKNWAWRCSSSAGVRSSLRVAMAQPYPNGSVSMPQRSPQN